MYKNKIKKCTLLFKKVISDFKKELDKKKGRKKGPSGKRIFQPFFRRNEK